MEGERVDSSLGFINLSPNNGDESLAVNLSGQVHQLPCCIKYDGPCPVSHYFKPKSTGIEVDGLKVEEGHFRGRKLQGVTISLPDGYSGFVLGKKSTGKRKVSDMSEENSTCCLLGDECKRQAHAHMLRDDIGFKRSTSQ